MFHRLALLFGLLVPVIAWAQVNALPPTRHILVYGDAQAQAIPDRFRVRVAFSALDADPGVARQRIEDSVATVIARLRKAGVGERDIVATSLSIEPENRYDEKQRMQVFAGTRVRRSLTARFARKQALEQFLAGLETSQELSVSDVATEVSDEPALRAALRAKAIESTREKAGVIAASYGARLGAVYSVSDVAPQFQYGVQEGGWPALYRWNAGEQSLDRIVVSGTRLQGAPPPAPPAPPAALQVGYVTFTDRLYAVFLLAD
ncbi:MAG TPA: SIMPL domain-containing protein [Lysobacter sp.]